MLKWEKITRVILQLVKHNVKRSYQDKLVLFFKVPSQKKKKRFYFSKFKPHISLHIIAHIYKQLLTLILFFCFWLFLMAFYQIDNFILI